MDIDLKPCPFCGFDTAKIITIRDGRVVNCHNCHASGPAYYHGIQGISATPAPAAGKWNQRDNAEVLRLTARIAQLEAVVKAGDGLAEAAQAASDDLTEWLKVAVDDGYDEVKTNAVQDNLDTTLTTYRAAKEASQ